MSGSVAGRRQFVAASLRRVLAVLVLAVAFPLLGAPSGPAFGAPAAVDLNASPVAGFAAVSGRLVVAGLREVLLVSESGSVLLRRSLPGILRAVAPSEDGTAVYVARSEPAGVEKLDSTTLATVASITFTDGGCPEDLLAAGGRVWIREACTTLPLASVDASLSTPPRHVAWVPELDVTMAASADGSRLFLRRPQGIYGPDGREVVSVVDATDPAGGVLATASFPSQEPSAGMAVSPDGTTLVVGGKPVRVMDARTLQPTITLQAHDPVDQLLVTRDGRHVVGTSTRHKLGGQDEDLLWWSIDHTGQIGSALPNPFDVRPRLAASQDGRTAFQLGDDGILHIVPLGPDPARLEIGLDPGPAPGLVRVHGRLAMTDGSDPSGRLVVVSRATPSRPPVPFPVVTGLDGGFSVDEAVPPGPVTYRARWAGDVSHREALALVSAGSLPPIQVPAPSGQADRAVPVPAGSRLLLLDDLHGRVLLDEGGPPGTVAVHDLEGAATGTLLLPAAPLDIISSDAGTDLFCVLAGGAGIAVIDGASLTVVGILSASPLVPQPASVRLIGGRLWVTGYGRSFRVLEALDPADPVDTRAEALGSPIYASPPFGDASDPAAIIDAGIGGMSRFSLASEPPTLQTSSNLSSASEGRYVSFADGTLVSANGRLLRDLDSHTLAVRRSRIADTSISGIARGPSPGLFATGNTVFVGSEAGGVQIWTGADAPVHAYRYPGRAVDQVAAARDGGRVVAVSRQAGSAIISPTPPPTLLHILHDPFAGCRILPAVLAGLTGGIAATIGGVLTGSDGTPHAGMVTVAIGPVSVTVPAGADGHFSAVLVPTGVGPSLVSYAVGGDDPHGCTASLPVTLGSTSPPAPPGVPPMFSAATPPVTATAGSAYGPYAFTATGTPAPTFDMATGTLPVGMSLSPNGILSGTPTATGPSTFTVRAANGAGPNVVTPPITVTVAAPAPAPARSGYWMLGSRGWVYGFGDAAQLGAPLGAAAAGISSTASGNGYWVVTRTGIVSAYGDAVSYGGNPALRTGETVSSLSPLPSGAGYWLFTTQGRVLPYGAARFFGDVSGVRLNGPVLGSVSTPSGNGYYMVAADGGIFAFGDAAFAGSMGGQRLNGPVVGLAPDPDGRGYWLVASDGGIFAFSAGFRGSMGGKPLNRPVIGMVSYGDGYLMVASDGGIFSFSTRPFRGSLGGNPPPNPIIAVAPVRS